MTSIGSYEAKTHLPQLLERVEHGEAFTITRHGKPIARLVPLAESTPKMSAQEAVEAMKRFQQESAPTLGKELAIRDLINEGRRF